MVKFLCVTLTGHRVSVNVFLDEISIGISGFCKVTALPTWVGIIQSTEGLNRTKRQRKEDFAFVPASLLELGLLISSSSAPGVGLTPLDALVLKPLNLD